MQGKGTSKKLGHIVRLTNNGKDQCFLLIDDNVKMKVVSRYMEDNGIAAVVIAPTNVETTCHQGECSLIDELAIATTLRPYVKQLRLTSWHLLLRGRRLERRLTLMRFVVT